MAETGRRREGESVRSAALAGWRAREGRRRETESNGRAARLNQQRKVPELLYSTV